MCGPAHHEGGRVTVSRITAGALAAIALAACARETKTAPLYSAGDCRRLPLIDASTRAKISGAEDLAYDGATGTLFISAYDRRAVEGAIRRRAAVLPEGGLYAAPLNALLAAVEPVTLQSIVDPKEIEGGFRPHGISFDGATRRLSVINRGYRMTDSGWRRSVRILALKDGAVGASAHAAHCAANDLADLGERLFVSFDHRACGWRAGVEDVVGARSGGVETSEGLTAFSGVRHANGVAPLSEERLALAATRDKSLLLLSMGENGFDLLKSIRLPGAPDNPSVSADGRIVVAVHPNLLSIGLARKLGIGKAGSRIVRADPDRGSVTLLYDDPNAAQFSAASAAIEVDGALIAGSALDRGLLVCRREAP